jgi:hypothetical protein
VPPLITPRSIATVWAENFGLITRLHSGLFSIRGLLWLGATTLTIENGAQRTPLLASTPNALAMSSTETSLAPSTSEQIAQFAYSLVPRGGMLLMPILRATSTAFSGPTLTASWANQVFTERAVASYML